MIRYIDTAIGKSKRKLLVGSEVRDVVTAGSLLPCVPHDSYKFLYSRGKNKGQNSSDADGEALKRGL
ncbi:MAG: hypothetical protein IPG26_03625 [Coprothermobacter sp.]|nr:hypothetical protein [Coprothermobacter sp.]